MYTAPRPECTQNSDCSNDKACINTLCQDPCRESTCGNNAECRVQLHRPLCTCREGFTGNAQIQCFDSKFVTSAIFTAVGLRGPQQPISVSVGCRSDSECPPTQACVNKRCEDPCAFTQCGLNAFCRVDGNHRARCYCQPGTRGNPLIRCERPQCTTDSDCPNHLACRNERCADPCDCAPTAQCTVADHRPSCRCPTGYTGNPQVSCTIGKCLNPCHSLCRQTALRACGAGCLAHDAQALVASGMPEVS